MRNLLDPVDSCPQPTYHDPIVALPQPSVPLPTPPRLTLLEVKNVLYGHFLGATSFGLKDDLDRLQLGAPYDDPKGLYHTERDSLVRAALDDMASIGLLVALGDTYLLKAPLGTFNQSVIISPYTAAMVADIFNEFARQTQGVGYTANKLAISDTEIHALAHIVFTLRDQLDEMYEQMDMDDEDGPGGEPNMGSGDPYGWHH